MQGRNEDENERSSVPVTVLIRRLARRKRAGSSLHPHPLLLRLPNAARHRAVVVVVGHDAVVVVGYGRVIVVVFVLFEGAQA